MLKKSIWAISLVLAITFVLTACGSPAPTSSPEGMTAAVNNLDAMNASSTPQPTESPTPSVTATPENLVCGPVQWDHPGSCTGDIATFSFDDVNILAKVTITQSQITLDLERVNPNKGDEFLGYQSCDIEHVTYEKAEIVTIAPHEDTVYKELTCWVGANSWLKGNITIGVVPPLGLTLTAMLPTGSPTSTPKASATVTQTLLPQ